MFGCVRRGCAPERVHAVQALNKGPMDLVYPVFLWHKMFFRSMRFVAIDLVTEFPQNAIIQNNNDDIFLFYVVSVHFINRLIDAILNTMFT